MKNPFIYMSDDATEDEVDEMDRWLWCRNFEHRNPPVFDRRGWRVDKTDPGYIDALNAQEQ